MIAVHARDGAVLGHFMTETDVVAWWRQDGAPDDYVTGGEWISDIADRLPKDREVAPTK